MSLDEERRLAERRGDDARSRRLAARSGEGPVWRTSDGRVLAPHQLETGHLVNVLKLKVRRHLAPREGQKPLSVGAEEALDLYAHFEQKHLEWILELEARKPERFDVYDYFRDRAEGWCETCPTARWRRKKGVRARGPLLKFMCGPCAERLGVE